MKKSIAPAGPDAYQASLDGWQFAQVQALRLAAMQAAPSMEETIKWGHLVYLASGPVLLIRAEPRRVLLGFWRGQRLGHVEPRLKPGGQYEMATLALQADTPLDRATFVQLVNEAVALNASLGDPTKLLR